MRIVFVINSLIHGGAETQVIAMSRQLAAFGHSVAIYTLRRDNPRATELAGAGVELVADHKRWKFDPFLIARLRAFLRDFRADIVQGMLFDGDFYARLATAWTGMITLGSERSDNYSVPLRHRLVLRLSRRWSRGVVANSHAGARFAAVLHRLPVENVYVVRNGLDISGIRQRTRIPVNVKTLFVNGSVKRVACLVGAIKPAKDYFLALRVAAQLTQVSPDWGVLFVGDAQPQTQAYKQEVLEAYEREEIDRSRIVFCGLRRDVPEILGGCDILFSTSLHEGLPNVVLEAMTVGVPVVSTAYSDIRRILPEPWQVVAERDPVLLADAILRADQEREHLVRAQRAWIDEYATIEGAARALESVYRQYVDQRNQ